MRTSPYFSVVVPVFEKWLELETLLHSLNELDFPAEGFEVIVVDNELRGSSERPVTDHFSYTIRFIHEPKPGSYRARNTGAKAARGECLAFTDADCVAHSDWLTNAYRVFNKGAKVIAGEVRALPPSPTPTIAELYSSLVAPSQLKYARGGEAMTANILVNREVFDETGGFNEEFLSGGDLEWSKRASSSHGLVFAPDVVVSHPLRSSLAEIFRKRRRVVGGMILLARTRGESLPWVLWFLPPWLCWRVWFHPDLQAGQKALIAGLRYAVHLYGTWHRIQLLLRLAEPSRA